MQIQLKRVDQNPESSDSILIWTWRNDSVTRRMSRNSDVISWDSHKAWYAKVVSNSKQVLLIEYIGDAPACMIRFDSIEKDTAEISFNLNPTLRGKGLGKSVLMEACNYWFRSLHLEGIYAEVKPENIASIKILEAVGFMLQNNREGLLTYHIKKEHLSI